MPSQRKWVPLFLLLSLGLGVELIGWFGLTLQKSRLAHQREQDLALVGDLKADQAQAWVEGRIAAARIPTQNSTFAKRVAEHQQGKASPALMQALEERLSELCQTGAFQGALLMDVRGQQVMGSGPFGIESDDGPQIQEAMATRRILPKAHVLVRKGQPTLALLDVFAPILVGPPEGRRVVGCLVLKCDLASQLFPRLSSWPGSTTSGEVLLLTQVGQELLYLTPLKHVPDAALKYRLPIQNLPQNMIGAMAVSGRRDVAEGIDYRQEPVLAAFRPFPHSDWALVVKQDQREVYGPLERLAWLTRGILFVVILMLCSGLWIWWRLQRRSHDMALQEQEIQNRTLQQNFELLSRHANDIVLLFDAQGRLIEANERACAAYGYTQAEMKGLNVRDLRSSATLPQLNQDWLAVDHGRTRFETVHRRKDGTEFPVEVSSQIVMHGDQPYRQSIIREITERVELQAALTKARDYYLGILTDLPNLLWRTTPEGRIDFLNPAAYTFANESPDRPASEFWLDQIHPEDRPAYDRLAATHLALRTPFAAAFRLRHRQGEFRWVMAHGNPIANLHGEFEGFVVACYDIHDLRSTELELRRLNKLYAFLSQTNQAIVQIQSEGGLLAQICEIATEYGGFRLTWIGVPDAETGLFKVMSCAGPAVGYLEGREISTRPDNPSGLGPAGRAYRENRTCTINAIREEAWMAPWQEAASVHRLGSMTALPLRRAGKPYAVLAVYAEEPGYFGQFLLHLLEEVAGDISFALDHLDMESARSQAELELRAREHQLADLAADRAVLLEAVSVAKVVPWSLDPRSYAPLNIAASIGPVLGRSPATLLSIPRAMEHLLAAEERPRLDRAIQDALSGGTASFEAPLKRPDDGQMLWTRWTLAQAGAEIRGVIQDLTEPHELQLQVFQAQKLESLGTLLGGVTHDFNNLLMGILGYAEVLRADPTVSPTQLKGIEVIHRAAERGRSLIAQLMRFSRKQAPLRSLQDLNGVVREVQTLLQVPNDTRIRLNLDLDPTLPPLSLDLSQIHQVVMNLAVNARDAIPGDGQITFRTGTQVIDVGEADLPQGNYAFLEVQDSGSGIPPALLARIFEPFFTTKAVGKGTGLGLAVVHGIVKAHGGAIRCHSVAGEGTCFRVLLPLQPDPEMLGPNLDLAQRTLTILLVEADTEARKAAQELLACLGHQVLVPDNEREARRLVAEASPDLVLGPVDLPPGFSPAFPAEIQDRFGPLPEIRALRESQAPGPQSQRAEAVIHWPYRTLELLDALARVIEHHPANPEAVPPSAQHS